LARHVETKFEEAVAQMPGRAFRFGGLSALMLIESALARASWS
jgi:hypothetical protein